GVNVNETGVRLLAFLEPILLPFTNTSMVPGNCDLLESFNGCVPSEAVTLNVHGSPTKHSAGSIIVTFGSSSLHLCTSSVAVVLAFSLPASTKISIEKLLELAFEARCRASSGVQSVASLLDTRSIVCEVFEPVLGLY